MMMKFHKQRGFTLVEILIVVIIIGILAALAIPQLATLRKTSWTNTCKANIATLNSLEEANFTEKGAYAGAQATLQANGYLKDLVVCPATKNSADYVWASPNWSCKQVTKLHD